jgi:hypothetical protein
LPDVVGVVNAPGQFPEVTAFDGLEDAHTQLRSLGDRLKADAFTAPPISETENIRVHIYLNPRV